LFQSEHSGTGRTARSENQNLRTLHRDALLQWTNYSGSVRVETIELSILSTNHRIASANFAGVRVSIVEVLQDCLLVRHRNTQAMQRNFTHAVNQILERLGMKRQIDGVDILTPQSRVHDDRRERMSH